MKGLLKIFRKGVCGMRLLIGAAACAVLALVFPAFAAPLDKNACAKLTQDIQNMKMLDVDKMMEKGPAWAASHLSPADLSLVRQYIDLDEQLKFRCSAPSSLVHHLKHLDEEDEEGGQGKQAESAGGKNQAGDGPESAPKKHKAANAPAKRSQPPRQSSGAQ